MKNNIKKQKRDFDRVTWMYAYAILNSFYFWLFPISLIICFMNGFTQINMALGIAGSFIFLCSIYTVWKNNFFNNIVQLMLNMGLSLYLLLVSSEVQQYTFTSSIVFVIGILIFFETFFVLMNFCFRKHTKYFKVQKPLM